MLDVGIGGGVRLSTGVFVLYADEKSFTLMTPQGHMFAGWITFSAERAEGGEPEAGEERSTIVQTQVLMRANDPLYELAMTLGGHRKEDQFWVQTMTALAKYLGAPPADVRNRTVCVDPRRQWGNAGAMAQLDGAHRAAGHDRAAHRARPARRREAVRAARRSWSPGDDPPDHRLPSRPAAAVCWGPPGAARHGAGGAVLPHPQPGYPLQPLMIAIPSAAVGVLVARRQRRNPNGWLLIGIAAASC